MTSMDRQPEKRGRLPAEIVTAGVLLLFGLFYGYRAVQEGVGTPADTGPGFFPLLVAAVLAGASAVVLMSGPRTASSERAEDETAAAQEAQNEPSDHDERGQTERPSSWLQIVGVLLAALAVPLLADTTGFVVTLSAAVVAIAKLMGMRGVLWPLLLGASFGATVWFFFVYWLFVPLPAGSLGLV